MNQIEQEIIKKRNELKTPNERFEFIINKAKEVFGNGFLLLQNAIIMNHSKIINKSYSSGYNTGRRKGFEEGFTKGKEDVILHCGDVDWDDIKLCEKCLKTSLNKGGTK